jgi:hypothetical protein
VQERHDEVASVQKATQAEEPLVRHQPQDQEQARKETAMLERRIVCAALCLGSRDIICGPRHFDWIMQRQILRDGRDWMKAQQGFLDQRGVFVSREEAWKIAREAEQIVRRVGGDGKRLYSENLY